MVFNAYAPSAKWLIQKDLPLFAIDCIRHALCVVHRTVSF